MSTLQGDTSVDVAPGVYALGSSAPDRRAIVAPDRTVTTYGQLGAAANRISNTLRELGLRAGDVVATMLHNSVEHFEVTLATGQIGVYIVQMNTHLSPEEAAYIVADSGARVLIASIDLAETLTPVLRDLPTARFVVGGAVAGWGDYSRFRSGRPDTAPSDRTAGLIMGYTSGTTGRPKGVRRELPSLQPEVLIGAAGGALGTFGLRPGHGVHLACSPLYHTAPGYFALNALHVGHSLVLHEIFDAENVLRAVEEYRVTSTHMVPTHVHRILGLPAEARDGYDLSSLETILVAGAPFAHQAKRTLIDWLGPIVWEYLGSTEGMVCSVSPPEALEHPGTVGKPADVKILDEAGNPVPAGEGGKIYFSVAHAPFRYHNDREKTAAAVRPDGYATVGDLGRLDADGYLYLLDRRDDLVISGGVNIYPAEVEQHLIGHPAVADVAVIGVADPEWGQRVVAVVEPVPGSAPEQELGTELDQYCRAVLSSQKCPRRYEFRTPLPRTETGKLLRRLIRQEIGG